jgi:hypothetical protein
MSSRLDAPEMGATGNDTSSPFAGGAPADHDAGSDHDAPAAPTQLMVAAWAGNAVATATQTPRASAAAPLTHCTST